MSNIDLRCDECNEYEEYKRRDKYDKKNKNDVVLACGHVCDDNVAILDANRKVQIAFLEIDLKHMKEPLVKLDFSSIVKFRDLDEGLLAQNNGILPISAANASFTLKLYRLSSCCKKVCIGSWDFNRYYNDIAILESGLFLAATKDSFCFTKCDQPLCEDCVLYILEVHDTTYEENFITKLHMSQINFNAIAVDNC